MAPDPASDPLIGRELGRYRIVHKLRRGGMGVVYLARHTLLDKPFAVKVVRLESANDHTMTERFKREAKSLSRLTHPNTVTVTDFGATEDGLLFLVMEFLQGITCSEVLARTGPFPPERVTHIAVQTCDALAEAHAQGIVHRDIKPNNVLLTRVADLYDVVKVIDFGLAKRAQERDRNEAEVTRAGLLIGTPQYMPPEQIRGMNTDARGDIYSLGITLFRLLTGKHPFEHRDVAALFHMHLTKPPPLPSAQVPEGAMVDFDLDDVVVRCLAKDPRQRYRDVGELKRELADCASAGAWTPSDARTAYEMSRRYSDEVDVDSLMSAPPPPPPPRTQSLTSRPVSLPPPPAYSIPPEPASPPSGSGPWGPATPITPMTPATPVSYPNGELMGDRLSGPLTKGTEVFSWRRVAVTSVLALLLAFAGASGALWWFRSDGLGKTVRPARVAMTPRPAKALPVAVPEPPPRRRPSPIVTLALASNPAGATVLHGEDELGRTPCEIVRDRSDGLLTLTLSLKGYRRATRTIDVSAVSGDRHELVVNLSKIPPARPARKVGSGRVKPKDRDRDKDMDWDKDKDKV